MFWKTTTQYIPWKGSFVVFICFRVKISFLDSVAGMLWRDLQPNHLSYISSLVWQTLPFISLWVWHSLNWLLNQGRQKLGKKTNLNIILQKHKLGFDSSYFFSNNLLDEIETLPHHLMELSSFYSFRISGILNYDFKTNFVRNVSWKLLVKSYLLHDSEIDIFFPNPKRIWKLWY